MKTSYQIGIIGAGFGGITAALRLKEAGKTDFVIFERAADLGGTWRDNVYPGCACDVPSHLYSFKAAPNPNWSHVFSGQPEIWQYMKTVAQQHQLEQHIVYDANITNAVFLPDEGKWQLSDTSGRTFTVKMVISATGPLNRPSIPPLEGLSSFEGQYFHSAEWDKNCRLEGKKVAVIGTGASAIQIVPQIAPKVSKLFVFQRTPAWIMPRRDRPYTTLEKNLLKMFPPLQTLLRERIYWVSELMGQNFMGNKLFGKLAKWQAMAKLKREVKNPETRQKLTPNYTIGCKRVLLSDDYLPTFNRYNVELLTESVSHFTAKGLVTTSGKTVEADVVIFCTGFHAADTIGFDMSIKGLEGKDLIKEWAAKGISGYKGITVSGFPNLAFVLGPNTGLGHTSVLHMMDSQMNYIMDYLALLEQQTPTAYLNTKLPVQQAYNQQLQAMFAGTVWASGCQSWYLDSHGRNTTLYPRLTVDYRKETRHLNPADFEIVAQ